jgi:NADPH-dependent glutamate synthase beta subunit-like oxidoreductase
LTFQQAIDEANRCLLCHDAPCSSACPGGTDPAAFIRKIRFLNLKGAARTVLTNNPLGGACAYVCPTAETCRGECLRQGLDRPIDIDGLQRFAVEYGREHGVVALEAGPARREKVAVIGAGPAGLTAAARLASYGYKVVLFEARAKAGGMLRYGVPASRLGDAALDADLDEILNLGVELRTNAALDRDNAAEKLLGEGFNAVFVAPGLWQSRTLAVPGVDLKGVGTALEFLDQLRSAPEKASSLVKGKNVAIIGGGSVAMDVAHCARQLGAARIYAIALEALPELPATESEQEGARRDGLIIKPQCQVTRIIGEGACVAALEGVETEWISPGKLVPSNARAVEGTSFRLRVEAVVQAIGQTSTATAGAILAKAKKSGPLVQVDEKTQATSLDAVFAGGDASRGAGTAVAAVGDGKRAADAIHRLLSKEAAR